MRHNCCPAEFDAFSVRFIDDGILFISVTMYAHQTDMVNDRQDNVLEILLVSDNNKCEAM